ncbi:sensor histidine kinase [Clostridium felsineum]|uniref:sensor histidine kinase n=1 Tax=Clostridium felsineum TaxID=36839 RepID=UPI00098CA440|nr:GHKL domain-containing protein [Clostridium felsineum]URZ14058.1 hypothetical protein CLFE_000330 [Clostridium felsineum DSM 794]
MSQYIQLLGVIIILYMCIFNLYSRKIRKKVFIAVMILNYIISLAILISGYKSVAFIAYLAVPFVFIYLSTSDIIMSITISTLACLITIMWDHFLGVVYSDVALISQMAIKNNASIQVMSYLIEFFGVIITSKAIRKFIYGKIMRYDGEWKRKIRILIATTLVLMLYIFYNFDLVMDHSIYTSGSEILRLKGITLFLSYAILLGIIVFVILRSIIKEMELKSKENEFQSLQEYTSKLEKLHNDMRGFRHDYINILLSMTGYIQNQDMQGLEKFFNEKIMPLSTSMKSNNFKISLLQNIEVPEIKGMFSAKIIRAQEMGIDVYIDIAEKITSFNMEIIDLSRIIGILLDNAIEASEKCDKPSIKVALIKKRSSVMLIIINNYYGEIPAIYKIYKRGFSTKGDNRGIGLSNLKEIIGQYKNVMLDTIIEDGQFKQIIEIKNDIKEGA